MSSRSSKPPKMAVSQPPKFKPTAAASAAAEAAYQPPAAPTEEEFRQEVALALAAQGGPKVNNCWDDLNVLHDDTIDKISSVGQEVAGQMLAFTQDPLRTAQVEPWRAVRLAKLITQFDHDTQLHFKDLDQISALHKDRNGGIADENEFMQVVSLHGDYVTRQQIHQAVTMPQVVEMLEITGAVELNPTQAPQTPAANADNSDQPAAQA
jgi:hypothetical protein